MTRTLYLIAFSNESGPAHYALFIPYGNEATVGRLIHVVGVPSSGGSWEFTRNYDYLTESRKTVITSLAEVDERYIIDGHDDALFATNTTPCDWIEAMATTIPLPAPQDDSDPYCFFGFNCQLWVENLVTQLIAYAYIPASSFSVMQNAPRFV